jgi:hypothetical protein
MTLHDELVLTKENVSVSAPTHASNTEVQGTTASFIFFFFSSLFIPNLFKLNKHPKSKRQSMQ